MPGVSHGGSALAGSFATNSVDKITHDANIDGKRGNFTCSGMLEDLIPILKLGPFSPCFLALPRSRCIGKSWPSSHSYTLAIGPIRGRHRSGHSLRTFRRASSKHSSLQKNEGKERARSRQGVRHRPAHTVYAQLASAAKCVKCWISPNSSNHVRAVRTRVQSFSVFKGKKKCHSRTTDSLHA